MATATIVRVWRKDGLVHIAARVAEGAPRGNVEYLASVPVADLQGLTAAEQKEILRQALKAKRDEMLDAAVDVPGVTGTVIV